MSSLIFTKGDLISAVEITGQVIFGDVVKPTDPANDSPEISALIGKSFTFEIEGKAYTADITGENK